MSASRDLRRRIDEVIASTPVIDPHCHIRAASVGSKDLSGVLFYHHLLSELIASGMPAGLFMPKGSARGSPAGLEEKVAAALPYLPNLRSTAVGMFLSDILRDIYGVAEGWLDASNRERVMDVVAERGSRPDWAETVRLRCNLARSITASGVWEGEPAEGFELAWETPDFLAPDHPPAKIIRSFEDISGREITNSSTLAEALDAILAKAESRRMRAIGIMMGSSFRWLPPSARELDRIIDRVKTGGECGLEDENRLASACTGHLLGGLEKLGITLQLLIGARVDVRLRSTVWADPGLMAEAGKLFREFPEVNFDLSTACEVYAQEIAIFAKHYPNVTLSGYWWHTLYPSIVRKVLASRIEIVPGNKITGFFSDAYNIEWVYPKLKMVRRILGDILASKVEEGTYSEQFAAELVRRLLYENPKRVYGCDRAT